MRARRLLTAPGRLARELARGPENRHRAASLLGARARLARWRRWRRRLGEREVVAVALCEHMGDAVAAEPIARHLRAEHPHAHLVWIARAPYAELVRAFADVDEVLSVRCLSEWMALAPRVEDTALERRVFDRVVDLHVQGRYCPTCYLPYARADGGRGVDATSYYADGGLLRAFCRTAGLPALDEDPALADPRLPVDAAAAARVAPLLPRRPFVALHARSNQRSRDWSDDGWRELARDLRARDFALVEVGLETALPAGAGATSLAGGLSALETAEVLRAARLFVGVDSGPAHLAHAVGTPAVILLGRYGRYARYTPFAGSYADGTLAELVRNEGPLGEMPAAPAVDAAIRRLYAADPRASRPRVSVVIPAYGHAALIGESVASALAQRGVSREVIVVDDGSPDDTAERLAPLVASGDVRLVRQPNRGVAAARNRGLREARGELICLLDDDDLLREGALARLACALDQHPDAVLAHGGFEVLEEGAVRPGRDERPPTGDARAAYELANRLTSPGQVLARASALHAVGGLDERVRGSDDWDLWLRLARRGPFARVDEVTLTYRLHPGNASRDALRLARAHLAVALRHLGRRPRLLRAHLTRAKVFFVPLLLAEATELRRVGRPRRAALSALAALAFDPALARWRGLAAFVATGLLGLPAGRAASLVREGA